MTYITKFCEWQKGVIGKECAEDLTEKAFNYSMKFYGKPLCYAHQKRTLILKNGTQIEVPIYKNPNPEPYASVKDYEESTGTTIEK